MAKLKTIYDKKEDIPEGYGELYAERNGKFELTGVEGVKTQADIDRVNESLRKERVDHKETREKLTKFGDLDPEQVHADLEAGKEAQTQVASLTKDGKLDEGKIQERIEAAVARAVGPLQREVQSRDRQIDAHKKTLGEKEGEIGKLTGSIKQGSIERAVRDAAVGGKVLSTALDDAVLVGAGVFEITEDDRILTRDVRGTTPGLTPQEWLKDMQEKRPHWWPLSQGGGAGGGRGGVGGGPNPWTKQDWNITEQGRMVRTLGPEKAAEMATRAGSKLGATKPTEAPKAA